MVREMTSPHLSWFRIQKELFKISKPHIHLFIIGIIAMIGGVQLGLFTSVVFAYFIDDIIVGGNKERFWIYPVAFIGLTLLQSVFNYGNRYFNDKGGFVTTFDLRNIMFEKLQRQSLAKMAKETPGEILAKMTSDIEIIRSYLSRNFRVGLNAIYYWVSIGLTIYLINPVILLIYLLILPFLLTISVFYGRTVRPIIKSRQKEFGKISNDIQEKIAGIEIIKAFGTEEMETEKFEQKARRYLSLFLKAVIVRQLSIPLAVLFISIASVAVVMQGGILLINNPSIPLTLGELILINLFMLQLRTPTRLFGNFLTGINSVTVAGQRIFSFIYAEEDVKDAENATELKVKSGEIEFEKVSFVYPNGRKVLVDLSFKIEGASTIAILGPSGSGKSTLVQLIPRFYDPTQGSISIDGVNIKEVTLESLRRNIGFVAQETYLFSRTIRENIAFGKPDATMEEVIEAAKLAKAHDFIEKLPNGYETIIGERGITLSGGQQQRIAIARALLTKPKILIFDDSTSSVDAQTEHELQQEISTLFEGRTIIIVTQKLSSIRYADKILVLDDGYLVEYGTHDELMKNRKIYHEIFQVQSSIELEEERLHLLKEGMK
ncbi:MAG: ABC transporter ATP-binding protein [Methanobacteriota archaeon]|nr:MAG: ABC transporter ATP-binding protein [Euryarchaeota archaeon]